MDRCKERGDIFKAASLQNDLCSSSMLTGYKWGNTAFVKAREKAAVAITTQDDENLAKNFSYG